MTATPPIVVELEPAEAARLHLLAEVFADLLTRQGPPPPEVGDPAPVLTAMRKLDQALHAAGYRLDHVGWRIPTQETADA